MSFVIGAFEFEGPYTDSNEILPIPGIFGLVCERNNEFELLHLDQTYCLRNCLDTEEHTSNLLFYSETCRGKLSAIVHYAPELSKSERSALKHQLCVELEDDLPAENNLSSID